MSSLLKKDILFYSYKLIYYLFVFNILYICFLKYLRESLDAMILPQPLPVIDCRDWTNPVFMDSSTISENPMTNDTINYKF